MIFYKAYARVPNRIFEQTNYETNIIKLKMSV